jgi:carbonic anhydrase|tara:strand:+ start:5704 stop:6348 length:645 start_codon:yes stop_codon:yes gene_type:complete
MTQLTDLFENNLAWSEAIKKEDPNFFSKLSQQQSPKYLWIGCSDSRVPANQLLGLLPGDIFVHRNIANVVVHTDLNCLSVLAYAVQVLKVKHIIVTGHYGCGGVAAAMENESVGLIDHWLRNVRDVYYHQQAEFTDITDKQDRVNRLCELNVASSVANIAHTSTVQQAWKDGQDLTIHGYIYNIHDGLLKQLIPDVVGVEQIPEQYRLKLKASL